MMEQDPVFFLQLPVIDSVVQYASVASTMLHKDAQASALQLLSQLTDFADPELVRTFLSVAEAKLKHEVK